MPAEWEPHQATWFSWVHAREGWSDRLEPVLRTYGEMVRRLAREELVRILVPSPEAELQARRLLRKYGVALEAVEFFLCPTNRSWMRDYGPIFVRNGDGHVAITNWLFNGWGKYDNYNLDDAVPAALAMRLHMKEWRPVLHGRRVVLEGGSIDVNGAGALLATEECLLSAVQPRNPGMNRPELEDILAQYLGARKVLWLKGGIAGDDTHGHVDTLARFVNETTVVAAVEPEKSDVNYEPLKANAELLRSLTDQYGRPLNVVNLPMPHPLYFDGRRLPATYAGFYIANRTVLVPTFNDPNDRHALNILAQLFPDRLVTGIHAVDLMVGLGNVHSTMQQQPE